MANIITIFGITGNQGCSLAQAILRDPELSRRYQIRGITRDPSKPASQVLQGQGIEVFQGDIDDTASIKHALDGAHTVFAMTISIYAPDGTKRELAQGKAIADAAVQAGIELLIYSTVPSASKISKGKYPVTSFDVKDDVKDYIRTLPIKSAFYAPGMFMQNYLAGPMAPHPGPDGTLTITNFVSPDTKFPLVDISGDTGKYLTPLLLDPGKYHGSTFCAATRLYTVSELVSTLSRCSGKEVKYQQVPKELFAGFLPDAMKEPIVNMFAYIEEYGYFGDAQDWVLKWARERACGQLTEFDDALMRDGVQW